MYVRHQIFCGPIRSLSRRISEKRFQEEKVALVDEVIELDEKCRAARTRCEYLRSQRNTISKQIGAFMAKGQREEAEQAKKSVSDMAEEMSRLDAEVNELSAQIRERMLVIPNIIDPTVPIGRDDSENVELERFGEPRVPEYEVPYHVEIMERFSGIDLDSARKTSGNGFYYLPGGYCPAALRDSFLCTGFYD